jgi:2-polyprenyl-6-methoxyphenol hydroxylase-like FAD-dependent oxidoreductase
MALEELVPGFTEYVAARGGISGTDLGRSVHWWVGGGKFAACDLGSTGLAASRPAIEHALRKLVSALPQVEVMEGVEVVRLLGSAHRITGAVVRRRAEDGSGSTTH